MLDQLIQKTYGFTRFKQLERLQTNGTRQAHVIESEQGLFVLKITDETRSEGEVQTDLATLRHMAKYDFPAPRLRPACDGRLYVPYRNQFVYLYDYIKGREPGPSERIMVSLGELMGQLHAMPIGPELPRSKWRPTEIIPGLLDSLRQAHPADLAMARAAAAALEDFPSMEGLPEGLVHSDPCYSNLLEDETGRLYLIDWDDGGVSYPLLDVSYILAYLCMQLPHEQPGGGKEIVWRGDWAAAFLHAYESIRPLSAEEARLMPAAVRLNALVYLPQWGSNRLIADNFDRWQRLESVFQGSFWQAIRIK